MVKRGARARARESTTKDTKALRGKAPLGALLSFVVPPGAAGVRSFAAAQGRMALQGTRTPPLARHQNPPILCVSKAAGLAS